MSSLELPDNSPSELESLESDVFMSLDCWLLSDIFELQLLSLVGFSMSMGSPLDLLRESVVSMTALPLEENKGVEWLSLGAITSCIPAQYHDFNWGSVLSMCRLSHGNRI